jgi:hypothetical protein
MDCCHLAFAAPGSKSAAGIDFMKVEVANHIGWFLLPTVQWSPVRHMFGEAFGWELVFWWGRKGLRISGV